tara:strand:- start:19144 stop:19761 length:618 start_codon:yes stop_codon:yes gene_type:complete
MSDSTPDNPNDLQTVHLVRRANNGDQAAYDQLFAQAAERLQLFLKVRLGAALREQEDTCDLLQETYLAAHKAFARYEDRGDGSFVRWLCHIAENCIRARADYHGAEKRRPPADLERASQVVEGITAGTLGPVSRAARVESRQQLATAMAQLPRDEREAMLMRHFEGEQIDAIAQSLGTSETSARRLLGRAVLRLGSVLANSGGAK